jgi:hypothetical protein
VAAPLRSHTSRGDSVTRRQSSTCSRQDDVGRPLANSVSRNQRQIKNKVNSPASVTEVKSCLVLVPVIPATQEAEIWRTGVLSQPGQIVQETLS